MHLTLLATVLVGTLVGANAQAYGGQPQTGGPNIVRAPGNRRPAAQAPAGGPSFRPNQRPVLGGGGSQQAASQQFQQAAPAQQFQQPQAASQPQFQQAAPQQQFQQPQATSPQREYIAPQVVPQVLPQIETVVVTVYNTVNVPTYEIVTHEVVVTRTRDVRRTETRNTQQVFTQEITERQAQAGRANVRTAVARANAQSLVISTVQGAPKYSEAVVTVTVTSFATRTQVETSTLRVTHIDNVLEQTVVPVRTVVRVDQVETRTVTNTITRQVTSTISNPTTEPGTGPTQYIY